MELKGGFLFFSFVLLPFTAVWASGVDIIERSSLANQLMNDINNSIDCAGCEVILTALKAMAGLGSSTLGDVLTEACTISGKQERDVCSGVITKEVDVLHYVLKRIHIGSHTSKLLCTNLFGLCDYPDVRPYTVSFPKPKPGNGRPGPSGRSPIKVVHISDTHVDLSYETGSSYNCTKPICCRAYTAQDAPGNSSSPCGPYGNTNCDTPLSLEESMFEAIRSLDPKPAFSIYTGDVVAHDVWLVDREEVIEDFNATYGRMASLGLVYGAIGNHDTAPVNALPTKKIPKEYSAQWAYDALHEAWSTMANSAVKSSSHYGSYSAIYPGSHGIDLRVISYNSVFYYIDNFWAYQEPMEYDPNGQLAWLVNELQAAESAGQRAWLIAHVPTGVADHFHDYSHYFDRIVQRYEDTIAALFFGHTHGDQFQISYSNYSARTWDTATAMGYITPSLTPTSGPPAFRVYDVDPVTFGVLDYTVYIANISDPSYQSDGPVWKKYYSAKEAYGSLVTPPIADDPTAELTPAFWHNITVLMEANAEGDPGHDHPPSPVFQAFWARQSRGWRVSNCTNSCVTKTICGLRAGDAQYNCYTAGPGINFSKQGADGTNSSFGYQHYSGEDCEGPGLLSLFRSIRAPSNTGGFTTGLVTQKGDTIYL